MHEEENIALVKRGVEAGMREDYDTLRSLLTEDVSYSGPFQPEMHGVDEVIAGMKQWDRQAHELGLTWEHEYEEVWADEHRVVMLHHMTATRHSRTFDTHEVQIVEIRDGKASKITEYTAEPEKEPEKLSGLMA